MSETDVLVVGAGPVGLTAAAELRRRGVECRIIDRLARPMPYAKAVGVQPRTLEVWDAMGLGLLREALAEAVPMRGQLMFMNGKPGPRIDLVLPPDVPYGFASLPQYTTERLLTTHLAAYGTTVERGTELLDLAQDADGVTARLSTPDGGTQTLRARYVVGCDGAHSRVRRALELSFEGDAFPEEYMLGDVEVDWDMPPGFGVRVEHRDDEGRTDDLLVCIPLPGERRYRMSMLVPPELATRAEGDAVAHGLEAGHAPELHHIQAVLDRLSPQPTTASALRWSSVFRISHRLVDRYGEGRIFVAGDAAHIHPPTGGQGMNTGVQDAYNLAWKLALAVDGVAADGLLASYHAERHPIGEEVVGRTVRHARKGIGAGSDDDLTTILPREAQLLVHYRDSPLVEAPTDDADPDALAPGDRAPDCRGLTGDIAAYPQRLYDLLRGPRHTLLLYVGPGTSPDALLRCVAAAEEATHDRLDVYAVLAPDGAGEAGDAARGIGLASVTDGDGEFRAAYGARAGEAFLVRPDGYLSGRFPVTAPEAVIAHLRRTFTFRT
ncbi:FAD-dependent monooxygenase [Streptomyces sp. NPDC051976]|uniref:FAD-dependent monooxygenase n=1 Tax=Streptomyces sp. NPDC051976 TaxID=3154947 RepID=UPI00342102CC